MTSRRGGPPPLPNELPVLDRATEAALRASILRYGVLVAVVRDQHGRTLDGHHRARLADALGVDYPVAVVEVRDDEHAGNLVRDLNLARRHLDPEQRRRVVASLRADGHSLRAIGAAVGVSKSQVAKDVAQLSTGGQLPDRVTGLDGRSRPAKRRRRTKPACVERPPFVRFAEAVTAAAALLKRDPVAVAAAVPADARDSWASVLRDLARSAAEVADRLAPETTTGNRLPRR